ncbi:hypothetical protein [uncultured Tateyamaria sp.]|uniref:hypothetical protein n=1 Tax=uncultured Tateyamaria sp. TaxID=455651 RepID=UPI00260EF815|nr:hypothetical protein [uncultured Tateyamaria sp.]
MFKYDGISYPDQSTEVLADQTLGPMFRAFLDKKMCPEKYQFLDAASKKRDPKSQFKLFFADNATWPVNAQSDALVTAKRLGKAKDWKSKDWKKVYDISIADTNNFVSGEFVELFYQKDAAFKAHHVGAIFKQFHRQKHPDLMAELGVSDKKALANVAAMLKAGKKSDGPRSAKAYVKKNKIQMKAGEVIKKIKKAFKIK